MTIKDALNWCFKNDAKLHFKGARYQEPGISVVWVAESVGWGKTLVEAVIQAKDLVEHRKEQQAVEEKVKASVGDGEIIYLQSQIDKLRDRIS